jgi:hypothetical protein
MKKLENKKENAPGYWDRPRVNINN